MNPITSGIGQEARALDWFIRNSDRRNPTAFINTNPAYFADECAAAITAGTLATTPPKQGEDAVREAAHTAAWNAIYGPGGDPHQNPESYDFCCKVADAILAALSANQSGADAGEVTSVPTRNQVDAALDAEWATNAGGDVPAVGQSYSMREIMEAFGSLSTREIENAMHTALSAAMSSPSGNEWEIAYDRDGPR